MVSRNIWNFSLMDRGADLDLPDKNGRTPLSWSVEYGHKESILLYLERGLDIESPGNGGRTLLSWAACWFCEIIDLLLERGAEIESKDINGRTPLSWAAALGDEFTLSSLLDSGADILSSDINGRTPLSWAASGSGPSSMDIANILLQEAQTFTFQTLMGEHQYSGLPTPQKVFQPYLAF
jgi:hypothetical protein